LDIVILVLIIKLLFVVNFGVPEDWKLYENSNLHSKVFDADMVTAM